MRIELSGIESSHVCGEIGTCWRTSIPEATLMRWRKWNGAMDLAFWREDGDQEIKDCLPPNAFEFLSWSSFSFSFPGEEALKFWKGECAQSPGGFSYKLGSPCKPTTGCPTCVKNGLQTKIKSQCKDGARDTVKRVLEQEKALIGEDVAEALVQALDQATLESIGQQNVVQACMSCIDGLADWLKTKSQKECTGSKSCGGFDFLAGFGLQDMLLGVQCNYLTPAPTPAPTPSPSEDNSDVAPTNSTSEKAPSMDVSRACTGALPTVIVLLVLAIVGAALKSEGL